LGVFLDLVVDGEEVLITRRGKPVAKLVRPEVGADRTKAPAASHRVMELRKGITLGEGTMVTDVINEGRQ
jgi:antitoxin (DNA-binding transcriptional repressor) of toxin-antitoxin stability system